jgi:hypothetical protein
MTSKLFVYEIQVRTFVIQIKLAYGNMSKDHTPLTPLMCFNFGLVELLKSVPSLT